MGQKRSNIVVAVLTAIVAVAVAVQWHAEQQGALWLQSALLPQEYDEEQISNFWSCRPLSIMYRLGQIAYGITPLAVIYARDFHVRVPSDADHSPLRQRLVRFHSKKWVETLTTLGPVFVKAGQQVANRPDWIPHAAMKELQALHDSVSPFEDDVAYQILREELEVDDLKSVFDYLHLAASASLGQVYKAKLKNEKDPENAPWVAVKVQRPGMQEMFSLDWFLLLQFAKIADFVLFKCLYKDFLLKEYFGSIAEGSYWELDYENEARNQMELKTALQQRKFKVKIPEVYLELTTKKVLTTEWIDGVKISELSPKKLLQFIPLGIELFMTQIYDMGHFHADPHPGNFLLMRKPKSAPGISSNVDEEVEEDRFALLDFGLVTKLDETTRIATNNFAIHLLEKDFDSIVFRDFRDMGFIPVDCDAKEVKPFAQKFLTAMVESKDRGFSEFSDAVYGLFFQSSFKMPPFLALTLRGIGILEGIGFMADPEFNIMLTGFPVAQKIVTSVLGRQITNEWFQGRND